jgi:hypothetical protein
MAEKKRRLPRYGRVANPPSIRFTERDKRILEAVHTYDGMLNFPQIQRMFFGGKSQAEQRLKLLYQHGYLARPDKDQRRRLPEMIYWLDKSGAEFIASLDGTPLKEFPRRREPRWFQVEHDLAVNDFRLDTLDALQMSIRQRRPRGVIHHSDQGRQYTSLAFGQRCRVAGVRPSMGSIGDCGVYPERRRRDNALCESFFATLECELLDRNTFRTLTEARLAVFEFIEGWYNPNRRHTALDYLSPNRYEAVQLRTP